MEAETEEQTSESQETKPQEQTQQIPVSKLRDLRPEKDPMGAGRPPTTNRPAR